VYVDYVVASYMHLTQKGVKLISQIFLLRYCFVHSDSYMTVSDFRGDLQKFMIGNLYSSLYIYYFKAVSLVANYTKPPTVLVSPKHTTSGGNVDPKHNAISAWVEVCILLTINSTLNDICCTSLDA
jgi:hypothetical protein